VEARPVSLPVPDPDDLPFIEVALSGAADSLVTGNTRHFSGAFGPPEEETPGFQHLATVA
jgi:hypothetical protein